MREEASSAALRARTARRLGADVWIALAVAAASLALLAATADAGFVRDEGYYFRAARDYFGWFEGLWRNLAAARPGASFADAELRRAFGYNTEHPGLVKIAMGFTHALFTDALGWTSHGTGYRLASMILTAVGAAFTYLLGARWYSRATGLVAVALLWACPHVFYHAHLACFDGPVMGLTVVVVYAFWRGLVSPWWAVGAGVAFGLAIATKHNALFLPPMLLLAYAASRPGEARRDGRGLWRLPPVPVALVAMAALGPALFYAFYPYGWHDPIARIGDYLRFHAQHEHYPVDYFGELLRAPPFPVSVPFALSALTVPVPVLLPGLVGLAATLVRAVRGAWHARYALGEDPLPGWLLVVCVVVPPAIIAVPSVPIFGGTKHWMTMMPFFCLLAASVVVTGATFVARRVPAGALLAATLVIGSVALPAVETARTHPHGHTYYNELAMGHAGAAALRLPRTFWGGDGGALLAVLNEQAEPGARVYTHRMNHDDFLAYRRDGLIRSDLQWVLDVRRATWAIISHQREHLDHEYAVWALRGDRLPMAVVAFDGVPIASLYHLPRE